MDSNAEKINPLNDYLKDITISLDCEKDLKLYSYDTAFSNPYMGVIGINILEALTSMYE